MSQLKQSVIFEVKRRLNGKRFTEYDFDFDLPTSGATLLVITLRANPKYSFAVSEEYESGTSLFAATAIDIGAKHTRVPVTSETPGDVKSLEKNLHQSLVGAFDRIPHWMENVYADLKTRTIGLKELDELREQLESHIASHHFEPEEYFQSTELDRLNERLDELLRSFEKLEADHKITAAQLEQLQGDVEQMKQAAKDMPKGVWAAMAKSRMIMATRRVLGSTEGRQFMLDAAKRFLLGDSTKA